MKERKKERERERERVSVSDQDLDGERVKVSFRSGEFRRTEIPITGLLSSIYAVYKAYRLPLVLL